MTTPPKGSENNPYALTEKIINQIIAKKQSLHGIETDPQKRERAMEQMQTIARLAQGVPSKILSQLTDQLVQHAVLKGGPGVAAELMNLRLGLREKFSRVNPDQDDPASFNKALEDSSMGAIQEIEKPRCWQCGKLQEVVNKCQKCHKAIYCNRDCQKLHWKIHKSVCVLSNPSA